jgi:hypothetical protein
MLMAGNGGSFGSLHGTCGVGGEVTVVLGLAALTTGGGGVGTVKRCGDGGVTGAPLDPPAAPGLTRGCGAVVGGNIAVWPGGNF